MTIEELRQQAKLLPSLPGVYMMKDSLGNIIYVGKSKTLKRRVSSYFGNAIKERSKVKRMVTHIASFDYEVTDTELDALLLECTLIKKIKPIYNSLLKNDKRYRFIVINKSLDLPRAEVAYDKGGEGEYFGPYDIPYRLILGVEAINAYYKLPICQTQTPTKDCLAYLMGRCMGPCEKETDRLKVYEDKLREAKLFLEGKEESILDYYNKKMVAASQDLDFEKAVQYRDYITVLRMLKYRKEAIQFTLDAVRGIALVKMARGGLKLYVLAGTQVIYTECFEVMPNDPKHKPKDTILSHILKASAIYFQEERNTKSHLEKEEVDSAMITYYYLKTKKDSYYQSLKDGYFGKSQKKELENMIGQAIQDMHT